MSKRRRWIRAALIVGAVLVGLFLTRASWISAVLQFAAPRLARDFGLELEVGQISWNGNDRLLVKSLRVRALGQRGSLRRFDAVRLETSFDWRGLLDGELSALHLTTADRVTLELDFTREELEPSDSAPGTESGSSSALQLPDIELTNSDALIILANGMELEGEDLDIKLEQSGAAIELEAGNFEIRDPTLQLEPAPLSARFALTAEAVEIAELTWGEQLEARETEFRWAGSEVAFSWDARLLVFGATAKLDGQLDEDGSELQLSFDVKRLNLVEAGRVWRACPPLAGVLQELTGDLSFDLEEFSRSTGSLQVQALALQIDGSQALDLNGAARLEAGFLRAEQFELGSNDNQLLLTDVELPLELGDLKDQLLRGRFDLQVDARNLPGLLGRSKEELGIRDHQLDLRVSLDHGLGQIKEGQLVTEGGSLVFQSGTIRAERDRAPSLVLELFANFEDLAALGELFDDSPWAGNLAGQIQVQGTWPELSAVADLSGSGTQLAGVELGELQLRVEADRHRVLFPAVHSLSGGNELTLSGAVVMEGEKPRIENLRFDLDVNEPGRLLPGIETSGKLHLRGQAGGAVGDLEGDWSLFAQDLAIEGHLIESFEAAGTLKGERLRVAELSLSSDGAEAQLAGDFTLDSTWGLRSLDLTEFSVERGGEDLTLLQPATISFESTWPSVRSLDLVGSAGLLQLYCRSDPKVEGDADGEGDALLFGLRAEGFAPMGFLQPFLPEGYGLRALNGAIDARIDGAQLEFTSDLEVEQFSLPLAELTGTEFDHPWDLRWNASLKDDVLSVAKFEAASGETGRFELTGTAPFQPLSEELLGEGELAFKGGLTLPKLEAFRALVPAGKPWPSGALEVSLDLTGTWREPRGTVDLEAKRVDLQSDGTSLVQGASLGGRIRLGEVTELTRVRLEIPDALSLGGDGVLEGSLNTHSLIRGELPFTFDTPIRFTGGLIVNDSTWIDRLHRALGGDFFRRFGGQLAATLELTGTLAEPNPKGQLELSGGSFKLSPELPTIESLAGVLSLDGTRFEVAQLTGQLGGERFEMVGHLELAEDAPELDLSLTGKNLLFYRSQGVKLRSDADLHVTGTPAAPRVGGTLHLTDGRFVKRFDFLALGSGGGSLGQNRSLQLFSFRDEPLSETTFDVHITADEPFRIDNNVVKARIRPDLHLVGTGEFPELVGKLYVDGGKVVLPANDLFLRPGTINFDRSQSMIPELKLLLENRLRGYDVSVTVNGPYDEPEVTFSSSPPLGPEDLAALVWAGQDPGEGLTSRTGLSGAQAVGAYIAQDLLTRLFTDESTESDENFFDRFELFLGRDTTQDGGETIEMTYRLAEKVMGKADTMYLATERDIYAHVNFGLRFVFRFK